MGAGRGDHSGPNVEGPGVGGGAPQPAGPGDGDGDGDGAPSVHGVRGTGAGASGAFGPGVDCDGAAP